MFISYVLLSLTYRFNDYYSVCVIGGQHDGHLPFWLPSFVKLIMLSLHVLFAVAEINILRRLTLRRPKKAPKCEVAVLLSKCEQNNMR